jgi:ATP-binding cassette, subfamily B, bacterial
VSSPQSTTATPDAAANKRRSLKPLLALKPYILRNPGMLALAFVALVASALAMLTVPVALRRMIDFGFSGQDGVFINRTFMVMIAIGLALAVASASRFYCVNWLGERVVADLKADVFRHLVTLGPSFYEKTHSGEIMSRLSADTTLLKSASGSALSQTLRNAIMLIGALVMMFVTSPQLTSLVLLAIPAIVLPLVAAGRMVRAKSRAAQDASGEVDAYAADNLAAVRVMQAYTHERAVSDRYTSEVERSFGAVQSRLTARAVLTATTIFLIVASIVGVLWFGATRVIAGEITSGRLSQFILYAAFAGAALAELSEVWGEMNQAAGAAERLSELMAVRPDITAPVVPVPLPTPAKGLVQFDDVHFSYPSRTEARALNGVSFTVAHGETIAIVGPSGAGKSTIFNLILRFYDANTGRVLVDGVAVRDADPIDLRSRMSLVPQEIALFADTITENIRYGSPEASDAAVQAAARAAHADTFIAALPAGYATRLGERGVTLSGGQRQRIAIARAILRDAPILLLDEATSALDAESEVEVQKALDVVMRGRTTLVIAHRLATVQNADRILVIDKGRIVETGDHKSLIGRGGLYGRLADLQFGRVAAE